MIDQLFIVLFNLVAAIVLYTLIVRARKNKPLKFIKVEPITLRGGSLKIATIGWGICVILFAFSGLLALFTQADLETSYFITLISVFLSITTMHIASYVTTNSN